MSVKLSIGVMMFAGLLPLIVIAMLTDLTRGRCMMLLIVTSLVVLLFLGARTQPGGYVVDWLAVSPHTTVAVCMLSTLFIGFIVILVALDRMRRRRLAWQKLPPQREFGKYCIRYLERLGWKQNTEYSTNQMTICRMEKASAHRTFIFTALPVDPRLLSTRLRSIKWKDYGQHVIVTWQQQVATYKQAANDVGWDVVGSDQLGGSVSDER